MADILNLDALKVTRSVMMHGKERTLRSMTVEQFIEAEDFDEHLKNAETPREQISLLVDRLSGLMDSTTDDDLKRLTVEQLMALMAFASGRDVSELVKRAEQAVEGNGATPKS